MGTNDEIGVNLEQNTEEIESNDNKIVTETESTETQSDNRHQCWVCFATEEDDEESTEWVRPCRCRGTAKWVHQECLQRWIDEKQKLNSSAKVMCAQCNTQYLLVFPPTGRFVYVIEWFDRLIYSVSPFIAVTCVVGSLYWSAVSYGALTVMQVMGQEEGKAAMEHADPLMLLVGLPSIPIMLVLGKLIRWEDHILKLWRKNHHKIPILGYLFGSPSEKARDSTERNLLSRDSFSDPISLCRMFCGALLMPTAATVVGRCLYDSFSSNLHKTILGGLTFIMTKGVLKIYLRQQQFIRQTNRKVLNFNEDKRQQATQMPEIQEP